MFRSDLLLTLKGGGSPPLIGGSLVPPIYSGLHLSFGEIIEPIQKPNMEDL